MNFRIAAFLLLLLPCAVVSSVCLGASCARDWWGFYSAMVMWRLHP